MQTILGANGTIGSVLAKELVAYTDRIRLVSRNPKRVNESDELFPADLSEPGMVNKAIEGSEVVYLVLGFDYNVRIWEEKWPKLMADTIDACIKHKARLVFFDNVYMYGINTIPHMTEESEINPPSRKGAVRKRLAEMIMDEVKAGRLMAVIARSADFYGPGNEKSFVIEMVYKNIVKSRKPMWFIDADKKHSFTFTPDAAKATALLGNTFDAFNQVWHLPTDRNTLTGREFIELFSREMEVKPRIFVLSHLLLSLFGLFVPVLKEMREMMYQYDRDYFFDSSKFETRFNFKPTTYRDGIIQTIRNSGR
jgi:nucleoside-diphosphate-sugar epimerase